MSTKRSTSAPGPTAAVKEFAIEAIANLLAEHAHQIKPAGGTGKPDPLDICDESLTNATAMMVVICDEGVDSFRNLDEDLQDAYLELLREHVCQARAAVIDMLAARGGS